MVGCASYDFKPNPSRAYAVIGFEGLTLYWFEVEGAAFLSDKGYVLRRLEGYYDQRLNQRLVLQPRLAELVAQDTEHGAQEGSELGRGHLARTHHELAVPDLAVP